MKYVTKAEFDKFVKTWRKRYENDKHSPKKIRNSDMKIFTDHKTIVRIYNVYTGKSGVARCRKGDTFDLTTGIAIAYARYRGAEIPVCERPLTECARPLTEDEQYAISVLMNKYNVNDIGKMLWYFDTMSKLIHRLDYRRISGDTAEDILKQCGLT